ncbi:MAG: hypothetical protein D6800_03110, partial [Candidatus Zixiibacteriota bacterium]
MRKRKRQDWQLLNYKYRAYIKDEDIPQVLWDHARLQNETWNKMVEAFDAVLVKWKDIKEEAGKEEKQAFWNAFRTDIQKIVDESGLAWESRDEILDRFTSAYRTFFTHPDRGKPGKHFAISPIWIQHRYTGGGLEAERIFGSRSRKFSVLETPPASAYDDNRHVNRRRRVVDAHFGVDGEIIPLRLRLHRPIPEDSVMKRVALSGRRVRRPQGWGWIWHIIITLEVPPPRPEEKPALRVAAVDMGWRKFDDYLRVAYVYDGEREIEVRLPLDTSNYRTRRD